MAEPEGPLAAHLRRVWEASGIEGAAGVRLSNGDVWVSTPDGSQYRPHLIYSVTKTFIAVAVLVAADRDLMELDHPIAQYLPVDLPDQITVRRLLNHTGGVPDYGALPGYHEGVQARPVEPWTDEETMERALTKGLKFEPGAGFAYSNVGYMLLRQLLDKAAPGGMRGALLDYIIEPLGLTGTGLVETPEDLLILPLGRTELLGPDITDVRGVYHPHWVKHHVLASTVHDLLRFSEVLNGEALLSPARFRDMVTAVDVPVWVEGFERPGYGLGVMIDRRGNQEVNVGHAGGGPGYGAALFQRQGPGTAPVTAVVLSYRDGGPAVDRATLALLAAAGSDR